MARTSREEERSGHNITGVEQHKAKLFETLPQATPYVHCELSIVSYTLQSSEEGFLDYIKLGCSQCIQAVNNVLGKQFSIRKATDQKFRYPWSFPFLPYADLVAQQMRNTMCFVYGQTFPGLWRQKISLSQL